MNPSDLEQILRAVDQPSAWDIALGVASAVSAVASVVVAVFALSIARKAEASRDAADRALRKERDENRLRDALSGVIQRLSDHVRTLNQWSERPVKSRYTFDTDDTNAAFEDKTLRMPASIPLTDLGIEPDSLRPRYEQLRGALNIAVLAATPTSGALLSRLRSLTFTVLAAPQWHAAAQHLDDLAAAIAQWGGRAEGEAHFASDLDTIEAHYLDLARQAEALRED